MSCDVAEQFRITAGRENVQIAGARSSHIRFMADNFFAGLPKLPSKRCLDLLHIAIGVYAADRLVRRTGYAGGEPAIRSLDLRCAVQDFEFWSQAPISHSIVNILQFLTDEDWDVSFESIPSRPCETGHQYPLGLPKHYQPTRVALYSGGLDSAAGLANRLLTGTDRYVLVTIGHNSWLRKKAADQLTALQSALGITPLLHSTVVTALRGGGDIRLRDQQRTQRSRSFLFTACAIAVASAFDIDEIEIFENGVGSINLPLMTAMLTGGLATRGSHPTFLQQMSSLASAVTESSVRLSLPFSTMTKAQMLDPLRERPLALWAQSSRSCVHSSLRISGKNHCGVCPACIERRQAFAVAGIHEYNCYSTDIFSKPPKPGSDADYFRLYRDEAHAWLTDDPRPRRRMDAHLRITAIPSDQHGKIAALHTRHSREISAVYGR
jgi:7-cyano-7-deazaguanine synthase in queuosine biosynthesis